jgi:hypothetical protein
MQIKYRLFPRGAVFYAEDTQTRKQFSLRTRNRKEAEAILDRKNRAANSPAFLVALAKAAIAELDPKHPRHVIPAGGTIRRCKKFSAFRGVFKSGAGRDQFCAPPDLYYLLTIYFD